MRPDLPRATSDGACRTAEKGAVDNIRNYFRQKFGKELSERETRVINI
jgi:hypothetical protein